MSEILKELEDSWGVQRGLWNPNQWKNAAILCANSYDKLAKLTDDASITTQCVQNNANTLIALLKEKLEKSEALNTKLTGWINNKVIKKPVGRPFTPRQTKPLRTLGDLWQPTPKRGRSTIHTIEYKERLIAKADDIKNDCKIKTDIDAMRHHCRNLPARSRRKETEKLAKLLSRFRKEIEN
jgi:hypothetical protein